MVSCSRSPEILGSTGFSVTADGEVIVRVQPCGAPVDYVSISDFREGWQQNPGAFEARTPQREPFVFNLEDPADWWDPKDPFALPQDTSAPLRAVAASTAQNTETVPVSTTVGEIQALRPGQVLIGKNVHGPGESGELPGTVVVTQQEFDACPFPEKSPNAPRGRTYM